MRRFLFIILIGCLWIVSANATVVYSDAEDGTIDGWSIVDGSSDDASVNNVYNVELGSRVIRLAPGGSYDLNLANGESWDNRTDRFLSFRMNYTDRYTLYVSVDTTDGHRWIFFNDLNGHWGYHGAGILSAFGNAQSHNGTWQTVTLDLDRLLKDTEPNLDIVRVNGMRFGGWGGLVDNVTLYTPERTVYENGENGISAWQVSDNDPAGASVTALLDDEEMLYRGEINNQQRTDPFMYAYNDDVISLQGDGLDNSFTIGAGAGQEAWNNQDQTVLQWKMRNTELCRVIVHVSTEKGDMRLVYTPVRPDEGLSADEQEIHHGSGITRNGDGIAATTHTGGRWITYTRDLIDDLRDYDPTNRLLAVNGMTIQGTTMVDDIQLMSGLPANYIYPEPERNTFYEDAEDGTTNGWSVRTGDAGDIVNVYEAAIDSRVIQLNGGGSYLLGDFDGANAWNHTLDTTIAWRMRTSNPYTIHVLVQTTLGLRHLFYTFSPNRGLLHGFENGVHHGLGAATVDGGWRTITRDLERDLKDAEPENEIVSINGMIFNGGDGMMVDDIILYTPNGELYEDGESGVDGWSVVDNDPAGATITNIPDNDRQGRTLQGNVISLQGNGADNAYVLGAREGEDAWADSGHKLLQWRFRDFGPELEVLSADPDERGTVRDPEAFSFRVYVQTMEGPRDLVYTLGATHQGIVEDGVAIHHGLGDDRIRGSVWAGDDPMNEMGLWQTITRDLEEDIRDFEPNNELISINGFEVRNSGLVDAIQSLDNALLYEVIPEDPVTMYEDAEDENSEGWSIFSNVSGVAAINNIHNDNKQSRVLSLEGTAGRGDGFMLGARTGEDAWNDQDKSILRWSMNYSQDFTVYISLETNNGRRYVTYAPRDDDRGISGQYIQFGLGEDADNGTWQTFTRNIATDLAQYEPDNALISINAFMIRGSGLIDDIQTLDSEDLPIVDTIRPVITLQGESTLSLSLGTAYNDAGATARDNHDGDLTENIVLVNSVNPNAIGTYQVTYNVQDAAGNQALEVVRTVNVIDNNGAGADPVVYEDAEDENTEGWSVYANSSGQASIENLVDDLTGSRVIRLNGVGKSDGFMLGDRGGENAWADEDHNSIEWQMRYGEDFTIYISVETTEGRRYLTYTPVDEDGGVNGQYLRLGLGADILDLQWHTIRRNLVNDLHQFEPENELISINAFMVRGMGRFDNIQTIQVDQNNQEIVYEDAEDENIEGWSVYANNSGGASIENLVDNITGSRAIRLNGVGKSDGFMLGDRTGENAWNNQTQQSLRWDMRYGEDFTVYISVETTEGRRYLTYTPTNENGGLNGQYIRLGLGEDILDLQWHTVSRNLQNDLQLFEPDNSLVSINAFMVRGMGRFDNITAF